MKSHHTSEMPGGFFELRLIAKNLHRSLEGEIYALGCTVPSVSDQMSFSSFRSKFNLGFFSVSRFVNFGVSLIIGQPFLSHFCDNATVPHGMKVFQFG